MSSSSNVPSCTICNKKNAKYCARCKSTAYCSKICQQDDWKTHKLLCSKFAAFDTSNRPTPDHYRAVLFDPDKAKPEFIWLLFRWLKDDDDDVSYQSPETRSIIGNNTATKLIPVQYNTRLERDLMNTITIVHRDTFLIDGSTPNRSIASITATQPGEYHDWRGPILSYAGLGPQLDPPACKDLDMVDFRHTADYFLAYAYKPPKNQANVERVKGVRINCLGDVKMLKRPPFEEIELPSTDKIFTEHDASDIADRIGLPIFTRRCPPDPKWANSHDKMFEGMSPFNNQSATFLHQCCDPNAELDLSTGSLGWGWCPLPWQNDVGSTIVVRKDRRPLLPLHMEALARYCQYEVQPLMGHSSGECYPEEPMKREDVLRMICRPMFIIYWYKFMREKKDYVPSPYETNDL